VLKAYLKGTVAVTTAVAVALQTALSAGPMTGAKWVTVGIAGLGALSVILVPNTPQSVTGRHERNG
jgi:hypothetical protein